MAPHDRYGVRQGENVGSWVKNSIPTEIRIRRQLPARWSVNMYSGIAKNLGQVMGQGRFPTQKRRSGVIGQSLVADRLDASDQRADQDSVRRRLRASDFFFLHKYTQARHGEHSNLSSNNLVYHNSGN